MRETVRYISKYPLLLIILALAFVFHMFIIFPSGSYYCFHSACGYFFWGSHGHDSIWHLALVENAFKKIPFTLPIFSDALLGGYNIFLDLILFALTKFSISPLISFFKIMPILWFVFFTDASIRCGRKIINTPLFVGLLLFFLFFGGSFGYLFTLYHHGTLFDSQGLLSMQSGHILLNMQFGFSLVIILYMLSILTTSTITVKKSILLGILLFLNFGFKFYAGIISALMIGSFYLTYAIKIKRIHTLSLHMLIFFLSAILSLFIFYNPINSLKNGSVLIFSPFAHVHSMIEDAALFYLKDMTNARYFLYHNGFGPRLLAIELFSLLLYLFFNLGTRFIGLIYWMFLFCKNKLIKTDTPLMLTIVSGIVLTTLFIQRGIWWNTVQFFYYGLFLSNIFIARFVYTLMKKNRAGIFAAILIILLTLPISFDFIREFSRFPAPAYLPKQEIEALEFLKKQPDGVVLSSVYDKNISYKWENPKPLFAYTDTSYVSAFSQKNVYIADTNQLELLTIDFHDRLQETKVWNCDLIKKIDYIYKVHAIEQKTDFHGCVDHLQIIFKNEQVTIYHRV